MRAAPAAIGQILGTAIAMRVAPWMAMVVVAVLVTEDEDKVGPRTSPPHRALPVPPAVFYSHPI